MLWRVGFVTGILWGMVLSVSGQGLTKAELDSLKHKCWQREFSRPNRAEAGCQLVLVDSEWPYAANEQKNFIYIIRRDIEPILRATQDHKQVVYEIRVDTVATDTLVFHTRPNVWSILPRQNELRWFSQKFVYTFNHPVYSVTHPRKWLRWIVKRPTTLMGVTRGWCWFSSLPFSYRAYREAGSLSWVLRSWEEEKGAWKAAHPDKAHYY